MGADIHGVVERWYGDKWIAYRTLNGINSIYAENGKKDRWHSPMALSRNYDRFAKLAGVRGEGPQPRGMPDDASDTAKMLFDVEGDHSPSWLPLPDACKLFLETEHYELGEYAQRFPESFYFGVESEDMKQFRLVFWFDS